MITRVRLEAVGQTMEAAAESLHNAADYVLSRDGIFPGVMADNRSEIVEEVYERLPLDQTVDGYGFKGRVVLRIAR